MLKTEKLCRTFHSEGIEYPVLKDVDLSVDRGGLLAIVGKSGSGKSTLLHLLACLDRPTSGKVSFDGKDLARLSESERDDLRNRSFGFVFQQFYLNGRETVFENVALPVLIRGLSARQIQERVVDALVEVELQEMAGKRASDLSGGEKQRVCIARALVGDPKVIFADEPTGNLDSVTGKTIEDLLLKMNLEKGITVIVVTHDEELAARCRRTIRLRDGKIDPVGSEG